MSATVIDGTAMAAELMAKAELEVINAVEDPESGKTRLVGDVDFASVVTKAAAVTPVPGGVGPITDVWLLRNTIRAAQLSRP